MRAIIEDVAIDAHTRTKFVSALHLVDPSGEQREADRNVRALLLC